MFQDCEQPGRSGPPAFLHLGDVSLKLGVLLGFAIAGALGEAIEEQEVTIEVDVDVDVIA